MTDYPLVRRESSEHYGDTGSPLRVWIADGVGQLRYYHVRNPDEAMDVLLVKGGGAAAAGLEEREDGDWDEWYDDRGCDIDDLLEERRADLRAGDGFARRDFLDFMDRLAN